MLAGALQGKRFSLLQVGSVVLLTLGVLVSAFADADSKVSSSHHPFLPYHALPYKANSH
jgi:hypothetical protein